MLLGGKSNRIHGSHRAHCCVVIPTSGTAGRRSDVSPENDDSLNSSDLDGRPRQLPIQQVGRPRNTEVYQAHHNRQDPEDDGKACGAVGFTWE
jgi:hypothetical protein